MSGMIRVSIPDLDTRLRPVVNRASQMRLFQHTVRVWTVLFVALAPQVTMRERMVETNGRVRIIEILQSFRH